MRSTYSTDQKYYIIYKNRKIVTLTKITYINITNLYFIIVSLCFKMLNIKNYLIMIINIEFLIFQSSIPLFSIQLHIHLPFLISFLKVVIIDICDSSMFVNIITVLINRSHFFDTFIKFISQ